MSASRPHLRSTKKGPDAASRLQATLDYEEARRKRALRSALIVFGLSLVAVVAALVLLQRDAWAAAPAPVYRVENEVSPASAAADAPKAVSEVPVPALTPPSPQEPQRYTIAIGQSGYEPGAIVASADQPIILSVGQGSGCAAGFLIPALGVSADNSAGPVTVDLGRVTAGSYQFSCGMGMVTGELVVE